ncbi:crustacyanin-C1 subunit-like [Penaeus monodon]|uniref:crustacyanin-C1 subunit-like n=1 Tax=Penaeus monodon TaxID=6687 RepID=UPI0018A78B44|nr:crustacyanin-C1 subunit-like [Penaeus monodon]
MLYKAENCHQEHQKRISDLRSNMKSSVIVLALVAVVAANKIPDFVVPGKCPSVDKTAFFDLQRFAGVWYETALTKNPYQLLHQCVRNEYSFDGHKITAKTTGINAEGRTATRHGQIAPMPLGEANLSIDYEGCFLAPFVIVDTDYENFACIHSCVDFSRGYFADFAFIFSRSPSMSDQHMRRCETAFRNIGLDTSRFTKTVQGHSCRYDTQMGF